MTGPASGWFQPSVFALVVANLLPLVGVVVWGWDAAALVVCYWSENLIVGAITLFKMACKISGRALFSMAFFLIHYGGFCAVHGMLVLDLFELGDPSSDVTWPFFLAFVQLLVNVVQYTLSIAPPDWLWVFAALSLSHLVSLVVNYFGKGEHRAQTVDKLMFAPYGRVMILHVAVLLGGFGAMALGSPVFVLVALVLLKLVVDAWAHRKEHREYVQAESA